MVDHTSAAALRTILDGRWSAVRDEVRESLNSADWATPTAPVPIADYRERTTSQLLQLLREPWTRAGFSAQPGQPGDIGASLTAFECLGHVDLSLFVKVGVQVGLFGGAIAGLGTERHHRPAPRLTRWAGSGAGLVRARSSGVVPDDGRIRAWFGSASPDGRSSGLPTP